MRIWRIAIYLLRIIPLVLMYCAPAQSAPVLKMAFPEDFPPFYFRDDDGAFKGASYEIVMHICKKLGYEVEVTQLPNMRTLLGELGAGRQDITVNLTANEERRKVGFFTTTPHLYETQDLIVRADSAIEFNGKLVQMARYRFGSIFGWTHGPQFDNATFLKKDYVNNSTDQLRGLLSGRYDIAVNNRQFFRYLSKRMGVSRAFRVLDPPVYKLPVTIAVSRKYPEATKLVEALEREVVTLRTEKVYREILERYGFEIPAVPVVESP